MKRLSKEQLFKIASYSSGTYRMPKAEIREKLI